MSSVFTVTMQITQHADVPYALAATHAAFPSFPTFPRGFCQCFSRNAVERSSLKRRKCGKKKIIFLLFSGSYSRPCFPKFRLALYYFQRGCTELSHGPTSPIAHAALSLSRARSCGKDGAGAMATGGPKWAQHERTQKYSREGSEVIGSWRRRGGRGRAME